jgi:hypothetical protein
MKAARSFGQLGDPGQEFQGALHVGGGDGSGVLRGGFLQGSLGQVIQESGQAVASLEEQLQSRRLEGVGVDADFLKARLDIAGQLLARPGLQAQAKAQAG